MWTIKSYHYFVITLAPIKITITDRDSAFWYCFQPVCLSVCLCVTVNKPKVDLKTCLVKVKVKEVDLYSAFIVVPHTQGAQVRITQC